MNETIGEKGGYNDRRRSLRIENERKAKFEEEAVEQEVKELEKKVKKQQILTLVKALPVVIVGGTLKTIYDTSKNGASLADIRDKSNGYENPFIKDDEDYVRGKVETKIIETNDGGKVVVSVPVSTHDDKKTIIEDILFPEHRDDKKFTFEDSVSGDVKHTDTNHLTDTSTKVLVNGDEHVSVPSSDVRDDYSTDDILDYIDYDLDLDSDKLPDHLRETLDKLKTHKLISEYEKELKDIRYDLRQLIYEYSVLDDDSEKISNNQDADIILERLSSVIDKIDELKSRIKIDRLEDYDDNYIYYLIEDYLGEFSEGKAISTIKDSPLYIEIASKINELDSKKDDLSLKVNDKKEKLEDANKKFEEFKNKYYSVDRINNELLKFQYEQDRLLLEIQEKVKDATSVSEKVRFEFAAMSAQSKRLMNLLNLQLFLPGPRIAKSFAANTALYLLFMKNIMKPKIVSKKYKVVKVKDYSDDIERNIDSIIDASKLLRSTSSQIDKMIIEINNDFKDYFDSIPEISEVLSNLYKIKSEVLEKEYEMQKLKEQQEKVLEENNNKVLTMGEYPM